MPFMNFGRSIFISALAILLLSGCGGPAKPKAYPVSGKVQGAKESLNGVMIRFSPVDLSKGEASIGTIGEDESYELTTISGRKGAVAGKYKVVLALGPEAAKEQMMKGVKTGKAGGTPKMGPGMPMPNKSAGAGSGQVAPQFELPFPSKYSAPETSPTEVEVKPQSNVIDIQLQE